MREWARESEYSEEIEKRGQTLANVRRPDIHYNTRVIHRLQSYGVISINDAQKTVLNPRRLVFEARTSPLSGQTSGCAVNFILYSNDGCK